MNSKQRRRSARFWLYHVEYNLDYYPDYDPINEWCRVNIGRKGWDWCVSKYYGVYQFRRADHANWFKLKWL